MAAINCLSDRDKWRALINTVMNFRVFCKVANLLTDELLASQEGICSMQLVQLFIPANGNPLQVLCCSYQCLEIRRSLFATDNAIYQRGHTGSSLHTGDGEAVVSNWRTNYCSLLYEIEGSYDST